MQSFGAGCNGRVLLCLAVVALMSGALMAQETAPRTEIYGGYAWQDPNAKFGGVSLGSMPKGFSTASTFFFNKYAGVTVDSGASFRDRRANIAYVFAGPTVNLRTENVTPFFHALIGLHRVIPASGLPGLPNSSNGVGGVLGGGLDMRVTEHVALRVIQADYIWAFHNYGRLNPPGTKNWQGGRLGAGIVFRLGSLGPPPPPPAASCSAQPTEVFAGEPVQVTASPANFNPKLTLTYKWTATGGKVAGNTATTSVDTAGLNPGSYTATANISDGKKGTASCNASFTVKERPKNPPTISCSANPTSVKSGEPSTITSSAASPDNRPVTVSYSASGGRISGTGNQATLDTAGAPAGPITVTCTATDDRGLTNSGTTTVTVEAPPPPPPSASKLNEIQFPNKKKPARVDNEAKAILDDVALRLQRDADAKAVVVGYATAEETKKKANKNLAAQRAVNTKDYLVSEKGIDGSRIEVRTGTGEGQKAEIWIVPAGATFTEEGTTVVPEGTVKAQPRTPAPAKRKAKAKAAAPAQ